MYVTTSPQWMCGWVLASSFCLLSISWGLIIVYIQLYNVYIQYIYCVPVSVQNINKAMFHSHVTYWTTGVKWTTVAAVEEDEAKCDSSVLEVCVCECDTALCAGFYLIWLLVLNTLILNLFIIRLWKKVEKQADGLARSEGWCRKVKSCTRPSSLGFTALSTRSMKQTKLMSVFTKMAKNPY